jgi:hypothetical protein
MSRSLQSLLFGFVVFAASLSWDMPAQAKGSADIAMVREMVEVCTLSTGAREAPNLVKCRRRIAKINRLGSKILPALLTTLHAYIEEKYPFDFDVLLECIIRHKTAQVLENLVKLMQESKAQEWRYSRALDGALSDMTGVKVEQGLKAKSETPQETALRWKLWWEKNHNYFPAS